MKNETKFKEYMAMMCELHDRTVSKLLTDLYWKVLEAYTDEQCEAAFKELIYSSKFFPKPADFVPRHLSLIDPPINRVSFNTEMIRDLIHR